MGGFFGKPTNVLLPQMLIAAFLPCKDHMGGMEHFSSEQRGTLYVTNMPKDVTEREVHEKTICMTFVLLTLFPQLSILFRFMPGFAKVRLVLRDGKAPICFVDFVDQSTAFAAMQTLQGFRMDLVAYPPE